MRKIMLAAIVSMSFVLAAAETFKVEPAQEEYVYEGRNAAEWVGDLRANKNKDKARHALVRIGKDAIPALMQVIKDPKAQMTIEVQDLFNRMKLDDDALPVLFAMLKDSEFEVRRTSIKILENFLLKPGVSEALLKMLKDRDRAVAEAAEIALMRKSLMYSDAEEATKQARR